MEGWRNGWRDEEWMDGWMRDGRMDGWMRNGWIDACMHGWMDGCPAELSMGYALAQHLNASCVSASSNSGGKAQSDALETGGWVILFP